MKRSHKAFEVLSTLVVVTAALLMVGFQVSDRRTSRLAVGPPALSFIENWEEENRVGIRIGSPNARMVITEFMDFTCPYCQALAPVVDSFMAAYPDEVAVVFQHFPLGRPLSLPAAIAAECAARQDRFREMSLLIYERMTPPEIPDWTALAEEAGVRDLAEFEACISLPESEFPRIAAGTDLGRRTGVRGTPTAWVNGRVTGARDFASFEQALRDL